MSTKRKNIKLPQNEKGKLASMFLDKLYHYQGTFIASLIYRFLENNNLASEETLDSLTDDDAKKLAGIIPVDFNLPNGNLDLQPMVSPAINPVQGMNELANSILAALNTIQANNGIIPNSSTTSVPMQANNSDEVFNNPSDNIIQASNNDDDDNFINDDELEDFDFSLLEQFRQ